MDFMVVGGGVELLSAPYLPVTGERTSDGAFYHQFQAIQEKCCGKSPPSVPESGWRVARQAVRSASRSASSGSVPISHHEQSINTATSGWAGGVLPEVAIERVAHGEVAAGNGRKVPGITGLFGLPFPENVF